MTIAEEISALRGRIDVAYDHIQAKGGTIPATTDSWNLSTAIDSIPTGSADPAAIVPVRYLKSTGTQYIDTLAYVTMSNNGNENRMEVDFQFNQLIPSGAAEGERVLGAVYTSGSTTQYAQLGFNNNGTLACSWGTSNAIQNVPGDTMRHKVVIDTRNNQIWLDGQLSSFTYSSVGTNWRSVFLFARNNNGTLN